MAIGILNPDEPRDDFKLVYRADTKLNPPAQRKAEPKRKKRAAVEVPAARPLCINDMVISRDYMSDGKYRKLFTGTGTIRAITLENRRDFSGKAYQVRRMTVIVEGRRVDVLEHLLQFVGTAQPAQVEVAKVSPSPLPEKVEVIDLYPLLLAPPQIAGYLPARTKDNERTVDAVEAQAARLRVRGEPAPLANIGTRGRWVKVDGKPVKVRMG